MVAQPYLSDYSALFVFSLSGADMLLGFLALCKLFSGFGLPAPLSAFRDCTMIAVRCG
jgi:hypothetical protein